jgi:dihydroxy-acid dehydratase
MPFNDRSKHITEGVARSPNRAMYYALGYTKADFDKPMIGIANGHSTITPCNAGLQPLADAAIAAIKAAGANPQVFGTPTISDGMSMGTEGMKYSLVSREVIADCVETAVQGQWMDGVLVIGGCDKNMPGGMIGILRANVPAIYVYGGTIRPGRWKGARAFRGVFLRGGRSVHGRKNQPRRISTASNGMPVPRRVHAEACLPPTP